MGIITEISAQAGNKSRVNLFVDGVFVCGLDLVSVMRHSLRVGDQLEPEELVRMTFESERQRAFDRALQHITRRRRTCSQMREYLAQRGWDQSIIDDVIARLTEYGYIDDVAYAQAYISDYGCQRGARRLAFELGQQGVARDIITQQLAQHEVDDQLLALVTSKLERGYDPAKLPQFLARRGFDWDDIRKAIRIASEQAEEEDS